MQLQFVGTELLDVQGLCISMIVELKSSISFYVFGSCIYVLALGFFLLGNGMHVPMITAWFHYVLSRTVRRDRFYRICKNPTVVKSWSEPPDELFEDIEFNKVA